VVYTPPARLYTLGPTTGSFIAGKKYGRPVELDARPDPKDRPPTQLRSAGCMQVYADMHHGTAPSRQRHALSLPQRGQERDRTPIIRARLLISRRSKGCDFIDTVEQKGFAIGVHRQTARTVSAAAAPRSGALDGS